MSISIDQVPEAAGAASVRLLDELVVLLGDDLVAMWLHGGTTFPDRPRRPGDLDICVVITDTTADERDPDVWRGDAASRPHRIYVTQDAVARDHGVAFDTMYLLAHEVGSGELPSERVPAAASPHGLACVPGALAGRPVRPPPWTTTTRSRHRADKCGT